MEHIVSRETMRKRGADAFDKKRGIDDHNMNWTSPAIKDWQAGWRERERESRRRAGARTELVRQVVQHQLAKVSPP